MRIDRDDKEKMKDFARLEPGKVYETQDPHKDAGETMFVMPVIDDASGKEMIVNIETGRTIDVDSSARAFVECDKALMLPYGRSKPSY